MDWLAIDTGIIGAIAAGFSAFISHFLTKKKYKVEVDHSYLENIEASLKVYDSIILRNEKGIKRLIDENVEIIEQNEELRKEISELRVQIFNLSLNICTDLSCPNRIRSNQFKRKTNGKVKDRYDETKSPCRRGRESSNEERNSTEGE